MGTMHISPRLGNVGITGLGGKTQVLAIGAASVQSTVFGTNTVVRLVATAPCFVAVGANPVAAPANSMYLTKDLPEYFGVRAGVKIAVIQDNAGGATGYLNITEGAET